MHNDILWQTKLHARLHDPIEKALVLLRDPAGHEGGTSRALHRLLGFEEIAAERIDPDNSEVLDRVLFKDGIPADMYRTVRRADWWAAAADRPQWPMEEITVPTKSGHTRTKKIADWAQVRWTQRPVLIHPLTGAKYDLGSLAVTDIDDIKRRSLDHFRSLIVKDGKVVDWHRTLFAFWRFGPELREDEDFGKLGELWQLLPADTRVPDHSIWDHLDLVSAFAGAFAADPQGEATLLEMSIGPVQSFIAAARSTSDLWAGSHLLSRLAWEAMKPVLERFGPDAILFPRLRGVPQVDLWLRGECKLPERLFERCEWRKGGTDSNPLFSAALPNRFVAVVPASQAVVTAREVEGRVREWLQSLGQAVVNRLLHETDLADGTEKYCHRQMREQLRGFPEVHWTAVPFSLIRPRNAHKQTDLDTTALSEAMAPFFGVEPGQPCGFLATPAWKVLQEETRLAGDATFFAPNPGVLYPAVCDLAERVLAAAKSVRPFEQNKQKGWRCSLTGETEWLTTDLEQLKRSYRQQTDTLWAQIARKRRSWAKEGEHLGALPAIKRLWPTLFAEEVREAVGCDMQRFVVSTHTMALARQLDRWLERGGLVSDDVTEAFEQYDPEPVALPRKLMAKYAGHETLRIAKRLPGLLDIAAEIDDEKEAGRLRTLVRKTLARGEADKDLTLETYYALLLMDGDHMGRILSGDERYAISYLDSFHPDVREGFKQRTESNPPFAKYGQQKRALSPNRHLAISGALNDFALSVVRHVVEVEHMGRVIYAGGDDVVAMLPVDDLLPCMQRLRTAYSGHDADQSTDHEERLALKKGFALLDKRLMRMMGEKATASCGAVIAHHQAPLGMVLRELRAAESRAKTEGGRDAFSLTLIKRSGGIRQLTAKWGEPVKLLMALRDFLADEAVSRRAVYHSLQWLKDLPEPEGDGAILESLLAYLLARQTEGNEMKKRAPWLAARLTGLTLAQSRDRKEWLNNFLSVAEFIARNTRAGD